MIKYLKASICLGLLVAFMLISPLVNTAVASSTWYVKLGGSDANNCSSPATACATINGALGKAAAGDTILVTAETFHGHGAVLVYINKNIVLSGGWDPAFTTRVGKTVLDGQTLGTILETINPASASVEYFTLQNGFAADHAGGISNYGTLSLANSIIQHNHGMAQGGGITNYGSLSIAWSTIRDNTGDGIYNWDQAKNLAIANSTINDNDKGVGVHIYNQSASIVNTTIAGNDGTSGGYDGGGVYFGGDASDTLLLRNVTIAVNNAPVSGGGIHVVNGSSGKILVANSLIAGNMAPNGPDCSGSITSEGYNLVSTTSGCTFNNTSGDKLNIAPLIASLANNGGPTATYRLMASSPAIDGGNPAGCQNASGIALTIDQRGFPRHLDGNGDGTAVCDIGSYEYDPSIVYQSLFITLIKK